MRRVVLEFDTASAEDRETIARVYRHARVHSHVTTWPHVAIEADVPRRVLDRVRSAGSGERTGRGLRCTMAAMGDRAIAAADRDPRRRVRHCGPPGGHNSTVSRLHLPDALAARSQAGATRPAARCRLALAAERRSRRAPSKDSRPCSRRSPAFYPSEAALGYVQLAGKSYAAALERFDRALQSRAQYVPALVGRGEALLALSRDADALAAFEAAVAADPTLVEMARRVEVLRARAAQANCGCRPPGDAGESPRRSRCRLYEKAITASPDSAFLVRDLADIEAKQGKDRSGAGALPPRRSSSIPSDVSSRVRAGEILDARNDLEGAMKLFGEANALEPSADLRRRIAALDGRAGISAATGRVPRDPASRRPSRAVIWRR